MKCPQCGSAKTHPYSVEHFKRPNGTPLIRRRRLCDTCGISVFTAEVLIQEIVPEHPATISAIKGRPPRLPPIGEKQNAAASRRGIKLPASFA